MFYIVPVTNGVLDIDYDYLLEGIQTSENECYVKLREGVTARETWTEITEQEFEAQRTG